jgi:HAD superfamily hydrolase (TIGR01450 family)
VAQRLIDRIDGLVCDLDGVLYRGDRPIAPAIGAVHELRARGLHLVFCTNNSATPKQRDIAKLSDLGVPVAPEDLINSAELVATALRERGLAGKKAMVIGGEGMHEAVARAGLELLGDGDSGADVVVVGRDKSFDFDMLHRAALEIRAGAAFLAANADPAYPSTDGVEPGAGALVAAIAVASGAEPEVFGKPYRPMLEAAAARFAPGARLAIVGDQPETDLAGGRAMGWTTVLVLSGVTDAATAARLDPSPDLVIHDLSRLLRDETP